jgi:basic membrane protein A
VAEDKKIQGILELLNKYILKKIIKLGRIYNIIIALLLLISTTFCCELTRHGETLVVMLVTDTSGVGDKGFNEICWNGLQRARRELGIVVKKIESSDPANYVRNLSIGARYGDLTIASGFLLLDAMTNVSARYPDSRFVFIDGHIPDRPNVASYVFRSEEVGFLAGVLAAGMSESHRIGILKGMNIPSVESFEIGFRAGTCCADVIWDRQTTVSALTAGSFNDPKKGNLITRQLINDGCDIVFQLAGATGLGAITAVRDSKRPAYLIGVDRDQDDEIPGKVLTSALKRIDNVVYEAVKALKEGRFEGGLHTIGIAEGALSLSDMRHTRQLIPQKVHKVIGLARRMIVEGAIKLPHSFAELDNFKPINLREP